MLAVIYLPNSLNVSYRFYINENDFKKNFQKKANLNVLIKLIHNFRQELS